MRRKVKSIFGALLLVVIIVVLNIIALYFFDTREDSSERFLSEHPWRAVFYIYGGILLLGFLYWLWDEFKWRWVKKGWRLPRWPKWLREELEFLKRTLEEMKGGKRE